MIVQSPSVREFSDCCADQNEMCAHPSDDIVGLSLRKQENPVFLCFSVNWFYTDFVSLCLIGSLCPTRSVIAGLPPNPNSLIIATLTRLDKGTNYQES